MMSFVQLLSVLVHFAALCHVLAVLGSSREARCLGSVSALASVTNAGGVMNVVGLGDWRERTKLFRAALLVRGIWVL